MFVENSFMGFKFPNLTSFLSLMPHNRLHQVCVRQLNSVRNRRLWTHLSVSLPADELNASITSWQLPPSPWCCRRWHAALCDLQQLRGDADVPGEGKSQSPDEVGLRHIRSSVVIPVCALHRSPSQQRWGGPRCHVSGPWPSAAPRGQRSTDGLTKALKTTWSSWQRTWSALK